MQRYFAKDKINNQLILDDNDLYHIKTVMRMNDSEQIEVVYNNKLYIGCLENVKENINISIVEEIKTDDIFLPKIVLYIPLLKEQKMDIILQKATELGVSEIVPIILNRSIIKVKDDLSKKIIRWTKICKEASEQSKRTTIPVISDLKKLEELKNIEGIKLICSTKEKDKNIKKIVKNNKSYDKINVVIGPEGGITEIEEAKLEEYGFIPVTLGSRIMRVETVPIFIMSILNYEYME